MRSIKKLFKFIVALIMIPTLALIGVIIWSHFTGNRIQAPWSLGAPNFLSHAVIHSENIYDETGEEFVGKRGYIYVSSNDLAAMTPNQYLAYYNETLVNANYLWFSVITPDGSGLYIPDTTVGTACYCYMDDLGRVKVPMGYLVIDEGKCTFSEISKDSAPPTEEYTDEEETNETIEE